MKAAPWMERRLPALLVLAGLVALALAAGQSRRQATVFEDEREYLAAASGLLRHGELTFASSPVTGAGAAFREPGYPALLAATWWLAGVEPPAGAAALAAFPAARPAWRATRALHLVLLTLAAVACGWSALRLGGPLAGAAAFALVAASPELRDGTTWMMSEGLLAAVLAAIAAALVALAGGRRWGGPAVAASLGLAPLCRAEAALLLPLGALIAGAVARRRVGAGRWRGALLLLMVAALPSLAWAARNARVTGHFTLGDRGGLALAVRAALDRDVARHGALTAALAWTPLAAARGAAARRAPAAGFLDYGPREPANFMTRTLVAWEAARAAPGVDPLAVDRRWAGAALGSFARAPGAHLAAAAAVAWRGLFAERSPAWAAPFDLRLGFGLLLGAAVLAALVRGALRRDLELLALLAPALVLYAGHVAATELLPRYAAPLLPLAWTAVALAVCPRTPGAREPRAAGRARPRAGG